MAKARPSRIGVVVILVAALVVAILVAKQMGVIYFASLDTSLVLLAGVATLVCYVMWDNQRDDNYNDFDLLDTMRDERTGKAGQSELLVYIMAVLAIWWVVTQTIKGKDVGEHIIQILMIFVVYRGAKKFAEVWRDKPIAGAAPPPPVDSIPSPKPLADSGVVPEGAPREEPAAEPPVRTIPRKKP